MLNSKRNILSLLGGKKVDNLPVIPIIGHFAASYNDISIKDYSTCADTMVNSLVKTQQELKYDAIYIASDTWINAEAVGCKVTYPDNSPAYGEPILTNKSDISKLEKPNPLIDGRWPMMLEVAKKVVEKAGKEVCIIGNIDQAPFSLAAQLRGINDFMYDIMKDSDFAHKLLDFCTNIVTDYGLHMIDSGVDVLNTGDSPANMVGPKLYEEFVLPYQQKLINNLQKNNLPVTLHVCGDTTQILDLVISSGAAGIEIDHKVDIERVLQKHEGKTCFIGNIDPVSLILQASPDKIKKDTMGLLEKCSQYSGFIPATGCTVPPNAPSENIKAFVNTVREFNQKS